MDSGARVEPLVRLAVAAPFFLASRLVTGAYVIGAAALHLTRTVAYGRLALLHAGARFLCVRRWPFGAPIGIWCVVVFG